MPQGKLKTKIKPPEGSKKKPSVHKKPLGPKKGAKYIAPKKAKKVQAETVKKNLQKAINKNIESELLVRAGAESKAFTVVGAAGTSGKGGVSSSDKS